MKTRVIMSAIALTIAAICALSFMQAPYYQNTTVYNLENNVSFNCDVHEYGGVKLYNSDNVFTYADQTYENGDELPMEVALGDMPVYTMTNYSDYDIQNRVNKALSPEQKQIVGDNEIAIAIIVEPLMGKVVELEFSFSKRSPYNQLPPSVFRQIEYNFLSQPLIDDFVLTPVGRTLNYVMFSWSHEFK